jgi:hypothetical protein
LALAVPLSRFTPRVGGGSAFYVRQQAPMTLHEPSPSRLEELREAIAVTLVSFDRKLERLYPADMLPRYNRITVDFHNRSAGPIAILLVTVHRDGSKLGAENFYTEPFSVPELADGSTCRYEFLSFDAFNLPFDSIRINLTTPQEYEKRQLGKKYIEKAPILTKYVSVIAA